MKLVVMYLHQLVIACEKEEETFNPLMKTFSLSSAEAQSLTGNYCNEFSFSLSQSDRSPCLLLVLSIPDLVSRLFWFKYFKTATEVPWLEYLSAFILEFGKACITNI